MKTEINTYALPSRMGDNTWRLAVGPLMPSEYRRIFAIDRTSEEQGVKTGSIGFADFYDRKKMLPLPENSSFVDVLSIKTIGIEPQYQHQGYFKVMHDELVKLAQDEHKTALMFESVDNLNLRAKLVTKFGYTKISDREFFKLLK